MSETDFGSFLPAVQQKAAAGKFYCGSIKEGNDGYKNLTVINFVGPSGGKISAYCCNMNIDADGEPQAYAPFSRSDLQPKDFLSDAGWKSKDDNDKLKPAWEKAVKDLDDLEKQKAALTAVKPADGGQPGKPVTPPAAPDLKAIDDKIKQAKKVLKDNWYWEENPADRPLNYGRIFWHWYGVKSLPRSAETNQSWFDPKLKIRRRPVLDKSGFYEDVYGNFPVVQSEYEPGKGYFVSQMPHAANKYYPEWDQRYFLPNNAQLQGPFAALSSGLTNGAHVVLGDTLFALRLDSGRDSSAFPFRDSAGNNYKVGECGYEAFTGLGGVLAEKVNQSKNDFLLLYLAFPGGQTPQSVLTQFAHAPNADDFPMMLAFLAKATMDATGRPRIVAGDPIAFFDHWKKQRRRGSRGHSGGDRNRAGKERVHRGGEELRANHAAEHCITNPFPRRWGAPARDRYFQAWPAT